VSGPLKFLPQRAGGHRHGTDPVQGGRLRVPRLGGTRLKAVVLLVPLLVAAAGLGAVSAPAASAASGPVFTVMNTSETLPDGVWFRNSPHSADTDRVTGLGVYMNEQIQLECYAWGDAVGPYSDRLWYDVANLTRPTNAGVANQGYLNAHYINDGKAANQVDAGVPQCGAPSAPPQIPNPTYNRSAAVEWAKAHATDPQGSGTLCTWFVSQALWAGGMPQTAGWEPGTSSSTWVENLVDYLRANDSVSWTDITSDLTTNAVPAAQPGDIIVYDWNDGGTQLDHMSFVVDIASGQYPEVSEWGQFDFTTHPWYKITRPSSPYVERGWTWSAMQGEWLQQEHPGMQAYLLHINGGYFAPTY
jgi:hypothetical protein